MDYSMVWIGGLSGLAVQLVKFTSDEANFDFAKLSSYVPLILNPMISAFVVFAYMYKSSFQMDSVLAMHIGISAPFIIYGMKNMLPTFKKQSP